MDEIIAGLRASFASEDAVRARIGPLRDEADEAGRSAQRLASALHTAPVLADACAAARAGLPRAGAALVAVEAALPADDPAAYYRYNDMWRRSLQDAVRSCVVVFFGDRDELAQAGEVKAMLGAETGLTLPLEDYLMAVLWAVSDLARLCMNRVTLGDFETPTRCARFANRLFEGFKELNLRNDGLRKKYDGMKYDVKRMEEIMYDLSIRGLLKGGGDVEMGQVKEEGDTIAPMKSVKEEGDTVAPANAVKE